jgi:hypothetical protein
MATMNLRVQLPEFGFERGKLLNRQVQNSQKLLADKLKTIPEED